MKAFIYSLLIFCSLDNVIAEEKPYKKVCRSHWCYQVENLEGWRVYYAQDLYGLHEELFQRTRGLLKSDLRYIKQVLPKNKIESFQTTEIYLSFEDSTGYATFGVYHHSREALIERGDDPSKMGSIEIANARNYLRYKKAQPAVVLHELSHAYRKRHLTESQKEQLARIYRKAVAAGIYESVPYFNGNRTFNRKSYAITDKSEFFCESMEAYFWRNDFYPFNRKQLLIHDPEMGALLKKLFF